MSQPFVAPAMDLPAFNCPICGAYAVQSWLQFTMEGHGRQIQPGVVKQYQQSLQISQCLNCSKFCVWLDDRMIFPDEGGVPAPNPDLPASANDDYEEARSILSKSPRRRSRIVAFGDPKGLQRPERARRKH